MLRTIRSVRQYSTEAPKMALPRKINFKLGNKFAKKGRPDKGQADNYPKINNSLVPKFAVGQVYTPFNMTVKAAERHGSSSEGAKKVDQFKEANFDPLKLWKDRMSLSTYVSHSGGISGSHTHHLSKTSHKKLAKAIRRSRCAGIMPYLHKAPETLKGRGGM